MVERRLILRSDRSLQLSNIIDLEIVSAIHRALFDQWAPAHLSIMNTEWNAKGVIAAIKHPNVTADKARLFRDIIITAARAVDKGVMDFEENQSCERQKIHPVHIVQYMGKGADNLQKMREEFEADNKGILIPTQVWRLANPCTIRERRQIGEITASSGVFVVKGRKVIQPLVKNSIKVVGVWYKVETFMYQEPDSKFDLCCGWGHLENECGRKPKFDYCSGHHQTSDHKCNVVRCTANQGSLCGHVLEKCPNCIRNHFEFSMMGDEAEGSHRSGLGVQKHRARRTSIHKCG